MNTQHTPGPWRYERANPSPTTGEHLIAGAKNGYLAEIRDCGSGDVFANARLIAAAPDLLELARQIVLAADQNEGDIPADIVSGARAAIAKATGEAA
jgi:hypothetical protein